jgi:hypothetical protein
VGSFVASGGDTVRRRGGGEEARTHGFAAPAFAGCTFVERDGTPEIGRVTAGVNQYLGAGVIRRSGRHHPGRWIFLSTTTELALLHGCEQPANLLEESPRPERLG